MPGSRVSAVVFCAVAAMMWSSPAQSGAGETLEKECKAKLGLSDSACKCIGTKAEADLNEKQQALVVAIVTENDAEQAKLQADMTQDEMVTAGEFMTSAPGACASQ